MSELGKTPEHIATAKTVPVNDQLEAAKLQAAQLEIQLKQEELTAKRLEIQERLANIDESKKRQSDREIKRKQMENDLKQKARVFGQQYATDRLRQNICSHRKGGMAHARDLRVLHEGFGDPKYRPCPLLVRMVDAGWLGRKSGRGFYSYDK